MPRKRKRPVSQKVLIDQKLGPGFAPAPKPKPTGTTLAPPPPIPKKPPKKTGPPSGNVTTDAILKKYPGYRKFLPALSLAASRWKVDVNDLLVTLIRQGGTLAGIADTVVDRALNPDQYRTFVAQFGANITPDKIKDPRFVINYLAWRQSYGVRQYGGLDAWYSGQGGAGKPRGLNPSAASGPESIYKTAGVGRYIPQYPQGPAEAAGTAVDTSGSKTNLKAITTDKWVVKNRDGTVGFAPITQANVNKPPKNVVKVQGGIPLLQSQLMQAKQNIYDDLYLSFQGRRAPIKAVVNILEHGMSQLGVMYALTAKPKSGPDRFVGSPIWNRTAAGIAGRAKEIYGQQWKPDRDLIRKAIVESWDASTIDANLRSRPEYLQGPEFKTNVAGLSNVYQTIYGTPGGDAQQTIREAAGNGWTPDQFALWLRGQPEYTASPEYLDKQLKLGQALGLVTGLQPTLQPGTPPPNTQPSGGVLPNNQLVPGKPKGIGAPTTPLVLTPTGAPNG